ncbi:HopJ type III effector protein [Saccharospirillum impatiens]|uniref:HopJ type III effector protein n=1 Tax=Saccharospirillum impatiens TaxID=169438 RepID=UPI0003F747EE|nr:HopJ type III effector protein [Saccharospirillum impatiens]
MTAATPTDLPAFVARIYTQPEQILFEDTMAVIDANFEFTPVAFATGVQNNAAGTNLGSCKLLSFAHAMNLPAETTLQLFGDYYRVDVLANPDGTDHANIREFMRLGWRGVNFAAPALKRTGR